MHTLRWHCAACCTNVLQPVCSRYTLEILTQTHAHRASCSQPAKCIRALSHKAGKSVVHHTICVPWRQLHCRHVIARSADCAPEPGVRPCPWLPAARQSHTAADTAPPHETVAASFVQCEAALYLLLHIQTIHHRCTASDTLQTSCSVLNFAVEVTVNVV